jgi:hypothetical protein
MRMLFNKIITGTALVMALAALGGCGGGGGSSVAGGGVGGSGIAVASVGTVTGFGSVIVNGVTYATGDAEIFIENASMGAGDEALVQHLSTGMVVRVEGVLNADGSATASRVFFNGDLRGPVESIIELDPYSSQLVILGQTVVLGPFCVFRNTTVADIAVGMVLKVSGHSDESGQIQATYVQKIGDALPPNGAVKLRGLVQSVDAQARTYTVNALTVDFSSADLSGLPGGIPQVGQLLEARGSLASPDRLIVDRIEAVEEFGSGGFETAEYEGIITRTVGANEFAIGRYTVRTDESTVYLNLSERDLNRGTRVIVRGTLSDRTILADEISLPDAVRMESDTGTVDALGNRLTLSGMEPISIQATATTRIIGTAAGLDEIVPGDHVRMIGRRGLDGSLFASSLQVTPSNPRVELAGPVDSVAAPELVVLGVRIDTASIPPDRFRGLGGKPISAAAFFDQVEPGDRIAAEGNFEAGAITWSAIELEEN